MQQKYLPLGIYKPNNSHYNFLAYFIAQRQALILYRNILKSTKHLEKSLANEIRQQARQQFEQSRGITDIPTLKQLLSDGYSQFKQLQNIISLTKQ